MVKSRLHFSVVHYVWSFGANNLVFLDDKPGNRFNDGKCDPVSIGNHLLTGGRGKKDHFTPFS